jgi:hypothetical protein
VREFHAQLLFYASFAWRRKQAIEIDPMLAAAGSSGGGIEGTEAVAAVREGRAGTRAPTLPARGRSVRAANGFYANSFYIVSAV